MNRQTVVRSLVALIAAGSLWVGLTQPDQGLEAEQIQPAAHVIYGGGGGNVGVFVTRGGGGPGR